MPENVGNLGNAIVAKALKTCPKSKKLPNQVALAVAHTHYWEKVFLALITF